jgi:PRTRC genetic system protein B
MTQNSKTPIVGEIPPLPPYATGALFFLPSGDFLFRYKAQDDHHYSDVQHVEGAKFVTVRDVAAAFGGSDVDTGWIGSGVIRCGYCSQGDWFVFAAPKQKLTIQVGMANGKQKKLTLPIPVTVMVGIGMQYFLWAVPHNFSPDSGLCQAPFPNVHDNGAICWGQNTPPKSHHRHAEAAWRLFFESVFNGDLGNGKSQKFEHDIRRMLAYVARKKMDEYPDQDLVRTNHSLRSILHELVGIDDRRE